MEQEVVENGDGTKTRHYEFRALDVSLEVVPGVEFPVPAWTFEGQVPGPTIRAVEGDTIRITFINGSQHSHTIHPHLKNINPVMDGTPQNGPGVLKPGRASRERLSLWHFGALGAFAGAPVIVGGWVGALSVSPVLDAVFLGVGVGAILQVVGELVGMARADGMKVGTPSNLVAFGVGAAIMYATGLFIAL